jgi:hypothetical protein
VYFVLEAREPYFFGIHLPAPRRENLQVMLLIRATLHDRAEDVQRPLSHPPR